MRRRPVTQGLLALLRAQTGKAVGNGGFPPGELDPKVGWYVLYALPGAVFSGPPLADDHADVDWLYQVTSVGATPDHVEALADHARVILVGRADAGVGFAHELVIAGHKVMSRRVDGDSAPDGENGVLSYPERFAIQTTPGA